MGLLHDAQDEVKRNRRGFSAKGYLGGSHSVKGMFDDELRGQFKIFLYKFYCKKVWEIRRVDKFSCHLQNFKF